jgi:hypothetical protein
MNHQLTKDLVDHLPFEIMEFGFDDNTFDMFYRTVYLQVESHSQQGLLDHVSRKNDMQTAKNEIDNWMSKEPLSIS